MALLDRVWALVGDAEPRAAPSRVRVFQLFLAMHLTARAWASLIADQSPPAWFTVHAVAVTLAAVAVCHVPTSRAALAALAALWMVKLVWAFPVTSNHHYLEVIVLASLAFLDTRRDDERELWLHWCRWLVLIVLFYSGFNKLVHGTYFRGEMLAFLVSQIDHYAAFFQYLLPAEELARLRSYDPMDPAGARFAVTSPGFLIASNAAWLTEMVLPVFLVVRRTRPAAIVAGLAFVLMVEMAAREVFFGLLFINLLLLFGRRDLGRVVLPGCAVLYGYFLAMRLGWIPAWAFTN